MAGALTISTLNNDTGVLATQNGMTGIAKAWCNFDGYTGSTTTVRNSFNVSSVTYNAEGDYTLNFTSALANANYTYAGVVAYGRNNAAATGRYLCPYGGTYPFGMTTTSLRFITVYDYNAGTQGGDMVNIIVCGT
jgi:hypothetical protein